MAARLVEDAGFEACYVTGAGIANSYLGAPDIGLVTRDELAGHVSAMRDAVGIPRRSAEAAFNQDALRSTAP